MSKELVVGIDVHDRISALAWKHRRPHSRIANTLLRSVLNTDSTEDILREWLAAGAPSREKVK